MLLIFCTDIDDCDPDPCQHGGTCVDDVNSFQCICAPGYTDNVCSTGMTISNKQLFSSTLLWLL